MAALPVTDTRGRAPHGLPRPLLVGLILLAAVLALAILGPWLAHYDLDAMAVEMRLRPPSAEHWLGTDEFGRDVLSRLLHGAQSSLLMGFGATALSVLVGVPLGLAAGYYRGHVDEIVMRTVDVMISVPPILLGLLILSVTTPNIWKTMAAVGLVYVPIMVRLARSVTLEVASEEFVQAARARGERGGYLLFREILPNAWPPLIVEAALRITFAIMLGAALSFLGLGVQPPASDWGLMISEARPYLQSAPWIACAPGLALCATVLAINWIGDGLRVVLDPRLKRRAA
ncbi:ABC transporter permease subunit [Xylophilus rhododendri]|uniref:ABC transporter permease subunit n=1 Tax=Xylophilus rhododendri TaxID=2697032 RepID=A0A857J435_9BURK|nr:ABC transporter permease [Xylophilus rhododendri]QHI97812.1 ABC transporter permease subunit [Xylophilus rhododendri]